MFHVSGFRFQVLELDVGFGVWGLGFGVWRLGFGITGLGLMRYGFRI
jgi:hypothetical protein